ncbi:MAG: YdcF family protein [Rhodospirillales bacterium]
MRRSLRRLWRLLLLAGVLAVAWAIGLLVFISGLPRQVADPDRPTDAIVVLTGGSLRLGEGLALLRAGQAPRMFISGVPSTIDLTQLMQSVGDNAGNLSCCIELGHEAEDTPGNAREIASWIKRENLHSIRLVTGAYHMPRSLLELRGAAPGIVVVPHPVFPQNVRQDEWWRWPGTADLLIGEYHKYILAWLRYQLAAKQSP